MNGVSESAVVGVPHSDLGEAVIAIVVLNSDNSLTAEQIIQYAKEKLANFKVPKHVRFIDSLPRNTMSKVQKKTLREEMQSLFKDEKAL
jgi:malonyl-CoA/methylmalonyl-CoA synthetase